MLSTISQRTIAAGAAVGGTLLAASGALEATGLDWTENAVKTPLQHVTMALFAAALVALIPALKGLGQKATGKARHAWIAIAVGQAGVAAASTVSNIRGIDASWFPAVAVAANIAWALGTLVLAFALWRGRQLPRLAAVGLVAAYVGSIPLAILGGGIVAGAFWLALAYIVNAPAGRPAFAKAVVSTTAVLIVTAVTVGTASAKTTIDVALDGAHATRTYVDAPPLHTRKAPNDTPGDTVVLHAPLLDKARKRIGMIDGTFLTTSVGHSGKEQLTATLTFRDGSELAVQGNVGAFDTVTQVAVVGGTGKYAGARGQVTAHFSPRDVSLHIELD